MQYFRRSAGICRKSAVNRFAGCLYDGRLRRNAEGVMPVARRNVVEKCCEWLKPDATSDTRKVFVRADQATVGVYSQVQYVAMRGVPVLCWKARRK